MKHELKTLNNGLRTLFIDSPGSTAATVQIWFKAGSALEREDNQGIAHFLEHMFFKGTKKRPGAAIAHEVESFGGEINAFTSFDYTCYYINNPNNQLLNTVDILMDMVSNPVFLEEDLIPEREVVFEEYRRSLDSPNQYSFFKIQGQSFPSGYKHPILGREDTIKNFTIDQLKEFRNDFYNLQNSLLVVAGDFSAEGTSAKVEAKINEFQLPNGKKSDFPVFTLKNQETVDGHNRDVRMGQITIVTEAPDYNTDDAPAEDIALNCLGHGETSKLYSGLVLDGSLANSASTSTMFMAKGGVHFLRYNFPIENFKKSLAKLESILIEAYKVGFEARDIQKIKNQYISSKIFEMETIESYAFSLGHGFAQNEDIATEEKFIERVKKLSSDQINNGLRNLLTRPLHFSVQMPQAADAKKMTSELEAFSKGLTKKLKAIPVAKEKTKTPKGLMLSEFDPQVKVTQIAPGVKFLYRHNPLSPTFVMHAYLRGGLSYENAKNNGAYHLIAGLLTKGYGKVSADKIRLELEERSASLHGFAGKNAYGLSMHGLSDDTSALVPHFIGSLMSPTFATAKLAHEKKLTLRQLENQKEDPTRACFKIVGELMFNGHPYSQSALGTEATVKKFTNTALLSLHKKAMKDQEILVSYCGIDTEEKVLELLAPFFTGFKKARTVAKMSKKKVTPQKGKKRYVYFDREQTQIFYGIPLKGLGSKENLYLKMLTTHLGGQSSELFVEVRDRQGLCYSAQPIHFTALEAGYFGIYMASGHDKVERAVKAIEDIMERHKNEGLPKEDFERIKVMIEGQSLLNVQTNDDYANIYSVPVLQGQGLDYYHYNNKMVKDLTYEEFQKNIKAILQTKWNTVIVGKEHTLKGFTK